MVPGTASVDDPALADFWSKRRRRSNPPLASTTLRLLQAQDGRCPLCGTLLLHADQQPQHPQAWEQWFKAVRQAIRKSAVTADTGDGPPDEPAAPRLVHTHCRRTRGGPALLPACEPSGLA
jgi:RNA-directed DNA polymerase